MVLLAIEIIIALYFHDRIIRPYVGDLLVVILVYCFWKSFVNTPTTPTAICVLLFAFFIEWLQYMDFVKKMGWQHSAIARTIIGYSFEWIDLAAYVTGTVVIMVTEYVGRPRRFEV